MAIAEILTTKKEQFVVLENGHIIMTKGKYEPSVAKVFDTYVKPKKPETGPIDLVEYNLWGDEIYRENKELRNWRLECERIDEMNAEEHKKQRKAFKKHLLDIRKRYYQQEAIKKREEHEKQKSLNLRQKQGARAYLKRCFQKELA